MLLGPVWIAAVVLAAAGAGKLVRPDAAQHSMRSLGLPSGRPAVRALGAVELAVALAVFGVGGAVGAGLLAANYAALTVASDRLRRQATGASGGAGCGCFGRSSAPVSAAHVAANAVAAVVAAVAAVAGLERLDVAWPQLPAAGFAHAVLVATGAAAVIALLTVLPEVQLAMARRPAPDPRVHLFGPTIGRRPQAATDPQTRQHAPGPLPAAPHAPHGGGVGATGKEGS